MHFNFNNSLRLKHSNLKLFIIFLLISFASSSYYAEDDSAYPGENPSSDFEFKTNSKNKKEKSPLSGTSLEAKDLEYVAVITRNNINLEFSFLAESIVRLIREPYENQKTFIPYEEVFHSSDYIRPVFSRSPPLPS